MRIVLDIQRLCFLYKYKKLEKLTLSKTQGGLIPFLITIGYRVVWYGFFEGIDYAAQIH